MADAMPRRVLQPIRKRPHRTATQSSHRPPTINCRNEALAAPSGHWSTENGRLRGEVFWRLFVSSCKRDRAVGGLFCIQTSKKRFTPRSGAAFSPR